MPGIKIVTDSGSDIAPELLAAEGIAEVPLEVRLGDIPAARLIGLSPEQFWQMAGTTNAVAETSAPSPGAFAEAFSNAKNEGFTGVVCVTISSRLSATFQAARAGASEVAGEIAVEVIDSQFATMGEGLLVLEAAEAAAAGTSLSETTRRVNAAIASIATFGTLESLDALRRGGRIGSAQALIGSLLSIKPVIEVREGVVEGESRQRTRARSLAYLVEKTAQYLPLKRLAVVHADATDIEQFLGMLAQLDLEEPPILGYIGPTIGAHTGRGTIGVCLQSLTADQQTRDAPALPKLS